MAKPTQFRIVSNGIDYRVQWLGKTFFLKRSKWYWLRDYTWAGDYIGEFSTTAQAQTAINTFKKQLAAKEQGYIPIASDDND